jgi:hypothetical protein
VTQPTTPSRTAGRVNIAFTTRAEHAGLVDVARVGAAFALREKLPLVRADDFGPADGSNFNVGSVDPQGEFRDVLLALHPEIHEDPYRVLETLMSIGTVELEQRVAGGQILSLRELIGPIALV